MRAHQSCKREDGLQTSHSTLPATDEVHEALAVMKDDASREAGCVHACFVFRGYRPEGLLSRMRAIVVYEPEIICCTCILVAHCIRNHLHGSQGP